MCPAKGLVDAVLHLRTAGRLRRHEVAAARRGGVAVLDALEPAEPSAAAPIAVDDVMKRACVWSVSARDTQPGTDLRNFAGSTTSMRAIPCG